MASLIFITLVGWYVYAYVTQESVGLDLFGVPLPSLSIALWVVVPLVILYALTVLHIFFYSFVGNLKARKYEKDYAKIMDSIIDSYLGKDDKTYTYKTPRYKLLGTIVHNSLLFPTANLSSNTENEKLNKVLKLIDELNNGEVVELKQYALKPSNKLVMMNNRNKYNKSILNAEKILSKSDVYDRELCEDAYVDFVKVSPLYAIEKYKQFLNKKSLFEILYRVNAVENRLEISNETLSAMFKTLDLNAKDYIEISKALSTGFSPEQRIKLFETLSDEDDKVMEAYLFTLFDLEMLAPTVEILQNSQPDEFINFKAYSALKQCNKNFDISLFI
jgi:Ca2+-binding EF-hand superfamily protein